MRCTRNSGSGISPSSVYKYAVPFAVLGLVDVLVYQIARISDFALINLVTTGIYGVLSVLEIGLVPLLATAATVFWILRIVRQKTDVHTWITLALILLGLVWAVGKLIFWIGAF